MSSPDAILRHAITAPVFDRDKVHREHLVDALHASVPKKLILITAPAGYGKTTLLADFHKHTHLPVCWLRLTPGDTDVMRLAAVLIGSLERKFRRLKGRLRPESLSGLSPEGVARTLASVVDEYIGEAFVLLIDDIHLIKEARPVVGFFEAWLEAQPDQVTLVLAGREAPPIRITGLVAKDEVVVFGQEDLALTREELRAVIEKRMRREVSEEEIDRFQEGTEGWVTGLLLSEQLLSKHIPLAEQARWPMVYDYLAAEVFDRQPEDLKEFMLQSSVLPVMTAEACNQVLDRTDSQRMLNRLVRQGLFVTVTDDSPRVYEYQQQLREFLRQELLKMGSQYFHISEKAADYLVKSGELDAAIWILIRIEKYRLAAELAEEYSRKLFELNQAATLQTLSEILSSKGIGTPWLLYHLSTIFLVQGRLDEAQSSILRSREANRVGELSLLEALLTINEGWVSYFRGLTDGMRVSVERVRDIALSEPSRIIEAKCLGLEAMALLQEGDNLLYAESLAVKAVLLSESESDLISLCNALMTLGNIQTGLGRLVEAYDTDRRAYELAKSNHLTTILGTAANNLGVDLHYLGRYEEALKFLVESIAVHEAASLPARKATALFSLGDLYSDLGLGAESSQSYQDGIELSVRLKSLGSLRYGYLQMGVLYRRLKRNDAARILFGRAQVGSRDWKHSLMANMQLAVLDMIACGKDDDLVKLIRDESQSIEVQVLGQCFLSLRYLRAKAYREAIGSLLLSLSAASGTTLEQTIAAELFNSPRLLGLLEAAPIDHPSINPVMSRITSLASLSSRFRGSGLGQGLPRNSLILRGLGKAEVTFKSVLGRGLSPLSRELLFYIACYESADRDMIVEAFWPQLPRGKQVSNLHAHIYLLRRFLGKEAIELDGSRYALGRSIRLSFDVSDFERLCSRAFRISKGSQQRKELERAAIDLYEGSFLPESSSNWAGEKRRQLELKFVEVVASYSSQFISMGLEAEVVDLIAKAINVEPFRDDLVLMYLESLGKLGRRGELVRYYKNYTSALADDLGLVPSESLRVAYARYIR